MIDNRRQAKINAVMAAITKGLAYDQHNAPRCRSASDCRRAEA